MTAEKQENAWKILSAQNDALNRLIEKVNAFVDRLDALETYCYTDDDEQTDNVELPEAGVHDGNDLPPAGIYAPNEDPYEWTDSDRLDKLQAWLDAGRSLVIKPDDIRDWIDYLDAYGPDEEGPDDAPSPAAPSAAVQPSDDGADVEIDARGRRLANVPGSINYRAMVQRAWDAGMTPVTVQAWADQLHDIALAREQEIAQLRKELAQRSMVFPHPHPLTFPTSPAFPPWIRFAN